MQKLRVAGHALHPMLVVFPLGLWFTSLVWDLAWLATGNLFWALLSFWTIAAGCAGALLAAAPGFVDWLAVPGGTRAKRVGAWHLGLNLVVLLLFVISAALRYAGDGRATGLALALSWIGLGVMLVSGWLGGELVERLGVGVTPGAHADAPSSLRTPEGPRPSPAAPAHGPRSPQPGPA